MPKSAFTLIELLIVVAIIGILAIIVLPNFLHAQIRAKVARSHADIRTISQAIAAYRVDNNRIPPLILGSGTILMIKPQHLSILYYLTTPIAYLNSTQVNSPFSPYNGYWFYNWEYFLQEDGVSPTFYWNNSGHPERALWMVSTLGPNNRDNPWEMVDNKHLLFNEYDPTNGVSSRGIIQTHGE